MVRVTGRDEAMLEWLGVVRLADIEGIRWALSGLSEVESEGPLARRKAQLWVTRMARAGLIGRGRPTFSGGSVVWPTPQPGSRAPDLFRQTTRHEVTVAQTAGRFLTRGYRWGRDRRPVSLQDHQGDGVAVRDDGVVDLVEVELSPKTPLRYRGIFASHGDRLTRGGITRVVYLCTPEAGRVLLREADANLFRDVRPRVVVLPVFDARGQWTGPDDAPWAEHLMGPAPTELSVPDVWEGIA